MSDYLEIRRLISIGRLGETSRARDARIALAELGNEAIPELLDAIRDERLPGGAVLVEILGEIGSYETDRRMSSADYQATVKGLRMAGGDMAARALIGLLDESYLSHLRVAVIAALGMTWSDLACAPLMTIIESDDGRPAACAAIRALGALQKRDSEPALLAASRSPFPHTRSAALAALANFGSEDATARFVEALRDRDIYVRLTAVKLLVGGECAGEDPWAKIAVRGALADWTEDLQSPNRQTAIFAAVALAQMRSPNSDEPLIEMLCFGSIPEARRIAAVALSHAGNASAATDLLYALKSERNEGVQRAELEALSWIATSRSRDALEQAKRSVSNPMRKLIVDLLKE